MRLWARCSGKFFRENAVAAQRLSLGPFAAFRTEKPICALEELLIHNTEPGWALNGIKAELWDTFSNNSPFFVLKIGFPNGIKSLHLTFLLHIFQTIFAALKWLLNSRPGFYFSGQPARRAVGLWSDWEGAGGYSWRLHSVWGASVQKTAVRSRTCWEHFHP